MRDLAREHTAEALATLVDVMRNGQTDRARAAAAEAILDRGHGKPVAFDAIGHVTAELEGTLDKLKRGLPPELFERVLVAIADEPAQNDAVRSGAGTRSTEVPLP